MTGVNKAILIGHLGRNPDIRHNRAGDQIATFSLATSESWRDKATGERKDRTEWHNVVVFDENICKVVEQYLKKGSLVYLEGKIRTREYDGKDGIKRRATEIVLERFRGELQMLTSQSNRPPPAEDADAYGTTSTRTEADKSISEAINDEIPF
ncbi:single-stranded DNA-binding protein [Methylocella tundrae]|uniref:Single-stranded DNA-binding protein n=1 Tax=Methylocella tundrae TaxID=227605 RepID=A0A4U8YWV9_METTU|nr:single-stranded DNA-binding protein [Methylocella tundrae]WPP05465.1 single-stranded DNA-binding protein [Methylocella tundrae]VFU07885.1 Single-stranded DNA-binding protein [Methylocella tundrae]